MTASWFIFGNGGHARELASVIKRRGDNIVGSYSLDGGLSWAGSNIEGVATDYQVIDWLSMQDCKIAVGIGNNVIRRDIAHRMIAVFGSDSPRLDALVDPSSTVGVGTSIGPLCQLLAHCDVEAGACLGPAVIVNAGAIVCHDVVVGQASHCAPRSTILGSARLGQECFVGAGSVILPGIKVPDEAIIGAGAVVTRDIAKTCTVVGIPARELPNG